MKYAHVAVLGIDGMGNFNRQTDTPCMDALLANGAVTYDALSLNPTISAQNWGAMLLGATPLVHGLTNGIVGQYEYTNKALPSLFTRIRRAMPDAVLASCCNWEPINHGIIEHDVGVRQCTADTDKALTPMILSAIAQKPTFLFVQYDDVDGAGHHYSYGSKRHLKQITVTDKFIGQISDAYKQAGIFEDTLFLIIADHGGIKKGHGGYTDSEKYIFLGAAGKDVLHGGIGTASTKDVAAIVLHALGLPIPAYDKNGFSSQIPAGIFPDAGGNNYIPAKNTHYIEPKKTPAFDAPDGLSAFLPAEKIQLALFFDNNLADATGKHTGTEKGLVKYYSDGIRGSYGEFGMTGHAVFDSVRVNTGSFTLAAWILLDRSLNDAPALCGNKDGRWNNGRTRGFLLSLRCADTVFNCGADDDDFDFITPFPEDVTDGWIHTILTVDKENKEVRCYYNFQLQHTMHLPEKYMGSLDALPFTVGDDGTGNYNRDTHSFLVHMDDLLLLDGTLSDARMHGLARYYGMEG